MNIASINAGYYISEKGLSIETLQVLIAALNNVFGFNMSVGESNKMLINTLEQTIDSQKQAISEQRNLIEMYKKRLGIPITDTQNPSVSDLADNELPTFIPIPLKRRLR